MKYITEAKKEKESIIQVPLEDIPTAEKAVEEIVKKCWLDRKAKAEVVP